MIDFFLRSYPGGIMWNNMQAHACMHACLYIYMQYACMHASLNVIILLHLYGRCIALILHAMRNLLAYGVIFGTLCIYMHIYVCVNRFG